MEVGNPPHGCSRLQLGKLNTARLGPIICTESHPRIVNTSQWLRWAVNEFENNGQEPKQQPTGQQSALKTYAVLLSLMLQLATLTLVFGYIGHVLAQKWHHPYFTAIGLIVGVGSGMSGIVVLAKHLLGGKP